MDCSINSFDMINKIFQKQPVRGVLRKRCPENMQQIYRTTPMREHKCDFNKFYWKFYFIEITLRHRCSPVNLLHNFRTLFPKNTSDRLLLIFHVFKDFSDSHKNVSITWSVYLLFFEIWPFKHQFHKMIKHTQTIRRQNWRRIVWECLTILWDWRLKD